MPKRLIFVDDEAMVLNGLRRALHGMRHEWNMTFVDSGAAALRELDMEAYDAVVTDMRMPFMDGAELLEQVKAQHADVVRIVLAGQSSDGAVMRSIVPAHQFLSKPCDIEELKLRFSLAFTMRDLLSNEPLKGIIARMGCLPSLPALYNELTTALRSESTSLEQIGTIIATDAAMATKILQLANSAFIGARGQVSSLPQALSLIGTESIRTLALSVHVFSQFDRNSPLSPYLPAIWEHSLEVACLARRIACSEGQSRNMTEQSFTAGLLHDVGKIVLLSEKPDEYRQILDQKDVEPGATLALEERHLGCTHAQVGAYLMSMWGLPAPLVHAVAFHHRPSEAVQIQFSPLIAVHCADAIVSRTDGSPLNRDMELDSAFLERLGLSKKELLWRSFHDDRRSAKAEGEVREP